MTIRIKPVTTVRELIAALTLIQDWEQDVKLANPGGELAVIENVNEVTNPDGSDDNIVVIS